MKMNIKFSNAYISLSCIFLMLLLVKCKKDSTEPITNTGSGLSPNDLLSAKIYDNLVVEVHYIAGGQPSSATIDNLKTFLQERLNKPAGISIVQTAIPSPGKTAYSLADITSIEKSNRTKNASGKTIAAYFLFLDGDYASNSGSSKVLGVAYGSTSMVIFEKTIKEFSGGIGKPSVSSLETTVVNHEFGHILGLTNNGTPMVAAHQDASNGRHCNDKKCLMYFSAETSDVVANILGGGIPVLDAQCIKDLQSNGGK